MMFANKNIQPIKVSENILRAKEIAVTFSKFINVFGKQFGIAY